VWIDAIDGGGMKVDNAEVVAGLEWCDPWYRHRDHAEDASGRR
jgi:hypothetical protein